MPPRSRNRKQEPAMTTTETLPDPVEEIPTPDDAVAQEEDATEEDETTADAATEERRRKVKPSEAAFFSTELTNEPPPAHLLRPNTTYERAEGYDDGMDALWAKYEAAGSPAWGPYRGLTEEDKPADGWYEDRTDIWLSAIVPDVDVAVSLVRRAAVRLGCSHRFKSLDLGDGRFQVWFAAAPILAKPRHKAEAATTDAPSEAPTAE